jgi:nucleotide-binding universal stress UspA family protein
MPLKRMLRRLADVIAENGPLDAIRIPAKAHEQRAMKNSDRGAANRLRFLVVVDGREYTNRLVNFVTAVAGKRNGTEAVVLNVQDVRVNARLRGYESFKREEIEDRLINEIGGPIVNTVSTWLQKAGVLSVPMVKIGDPVSIILDCAAENECDAIVIGEPRPKGLRGWIAAVTRLPLVSPRLHQLVIRSAKPLVVVK